jgi:MFS family permease
MVSIITVFAFEAIGTATAMPVIAADLGLLEAYTWAFSSFFVASLLAMVVGGLWCDARGPRGPIIAGVITLSLGSVVAGLANGLTTLVIGRSLQGLGGGIIIVGTYVLIARAYDVDARPRAFSVLSAAWIVPSLVGPLVAGWLAESVSWRAVFLLIPFVVLLPVLLLFPRMGPYEGGSRPPGVRQRLVAGVVAAAGLFLFQAGLLQLSAAGVALAALGAIGVVLASRRLLPVGALRFRRGLPSSVMMRGLLAGAFASAEVFVPLALVDTRGLSVTAAGLILATSAVLWSAGSYAQSRIPGDQDRSAAVRIGAAVLLLALLLLPLSLSASVPPWVAAPAWALAAFGMGLSVPSVSVQVMRLSPPDALGANSSAVQIVDALMVTVAVSVAGFGHAAAVAGGGATAATYLAIWLGSAGLAVLVIVLAGRMRPAHVAVP